MTHPWHDIEVDESTVATSFPVVIEVPKGSKNKYEIDKDTGLLHLDRVLHSAVFYPADYGFIPRTLCDDGDALDALVLTQEPLIAGCVVNARALGVLKMSDDKGLDDKIIAVCVDDPIFSSFEDIQDLPPHIVKEIERFFADYKILEGKSVDIDSTLGRRAALDVVAESFELYRTERCAEKAGR